MSDVGLIKCTANGTRNISAVVTDAQGNVTGDPTSTTGGFAVVEKGQYNTTPPTYASGQFTIIQTDAQGRELVYLATLIAGEDQPNNLLATAIRPVVGSTYSRTRFWVPTAVSGTVKNTPGNLFAISAVNRNAAVRFLQLFNATSATGTPVMSFPIAPSGNIVFADDFFGTNGDYFSVGISFGFSTTETTYTAATAADHSAWGYYV